MVTWYVSVHTLTNIAKWYRFILVTFTCQLMYWTSSPQDTAHIMVIWYISVHAFTIIAKRYSTQRRCKESMQIQQWNIILLAADVLAVLIFLSCRGWRGLGCKQGVDGWGIHTYTSRVLIRRPVPIATESWWVPKQIVAAGANVIDRGSIFVAYLIWINHD